MAGAIRNLGGHSVYWCSPAGDPIVREGDALDLIGEVFGHDVAWIAIPVDRLSPDFFQLRTGLAGAILQKAINYGMRVAVIGDLAPHIAASQALADFVTESNRGGHVWFLRDEAELETRLAALR